MTKLKGLIPENYLKSDVKHSKSKIHESEEEKPAIDLYTLVTDPTTNLTKEAKKSFLEAVSRYNEYSKSIYREQNLREISKTVSAIGKLAEKIAVNEADDWFDGMTVKRDMKSLQDSVKMFESSCKEMSQMQHRLESLYESIGSALGKYFEISDPVTEVKKIKRN